MKSFSTQAELTQLQLWLQTAITRPASAPAVDAATALIAPSATLSSAARLAIYNRSYHARLLQCFQEMFPALRRALGETLLAGFAQDYLQQHPPHSYTLHHLADGFAQHLAATRPAVGEAVSEDAGDAASEAAGTPSAARAAWPDFIIELATLEWAFLQIYDGPGLEGRPGPAATRLQALTDESLGALRLTLAPCLRLFALRYPVHVYLLAARRGETPVFPAARPTYVALTRRAFRVVIEELSATQFEVLQALDGQASLSAAVARTAAVLPPALLRAWLCEWAVKGFLAGVA